MEDYKMLILLFFITFRNLVAHEGCTQNQYPETKKLGNVIVEIEGKELPECQNTMEKVMERFYSAIWPFLSVKNKEIIKTNESCLKIIKDSKNPIFNEFSPKLDFPPSELNLNELYFKDFSTICISKLDRSIFTENINKTLTTPLWISETTNILMDFDNELTQNCNLVAKIPLKNESTTAFICLKNDQECIDFNMIKKYTKNEGYQVINKEARQGIMISAAQLAKELNKIKPDENKEYFRKAELSFTGVDFANLVNNQIYCEYAPTSTSLTSSIYKKKVFNGEKMKIIIPDGLSHHGKSIKHLSEHETEEEVLFPPYSCFKYIGINSNSEYVFELDTWKNDKNFTSKRLQFIMEAFASYSTPFRISDKIKNGALTVERPNHGLTHGARSAYLAIDILKYFAQNAQDFGNLGKWAQEKVKNTDYLDKLFLTSLYQRAARKDEEDKAWSEKGEAQDCKEFITEILKKSGLFKNVDEDEILSFANAIAGENLSPDSPYFFDGMFNYVLLRLAHLADHRRQDFWDVKRSFKEQNNAFTILGDFDNINSDKIQLAIKYLWNKSGEYLEATGAGDVEQPDLELYIEEGKTKGKYKFSDVDLFFRLENYPQTLFFTLENLETSKNKKETLKKKVMLTLGLDNMDSLAMFKMKDLVELSKMDMDNDNLDSMQYKKIIRKILSMFYSDKIIDKYSLEDIFFKIKPMEKLLSIIKLIDDEKGILAFVEINSKIPEKINDPAVLEYLKSNKNDFYTLTKMLNKKDLLLLFGDNPISIKELMDKFQDSYKAFASFAEKIKKETLSPLYPLVSFMASNKEKIFSSTDLDTSKKIFSYIKNDLKFNAIHSDMLKEIFEKLKTFNGDDALEFIKILNNTSEDVDIQRIQLSIALVQPNGLTFLKEIVQKNITREEYLLFGQFLKTYHHNEEKSLKLLLKFINNDKIREDFAKIKYKNYFSIASDTSRFYKFLDNFDDNNKSIYQFDEEE